LGDRRANIGAAKKWLTAHPETEIQRCSAVIETEPWGVEDQPYFMNAVVEISTDLSPEELLGVLKSAEKELGRTPDRNRWGPRVIDLDILLYGDRVVESAELTIPHAQLSKRKFVLEQIIEIDDKLVHPKLGVPIRDLLKAHFG
jgi:2-amino-4-hydroxy-6-hydroxymethyldihydropteridine diphosphokinase